MELSEAIQLYANAIGAIIPIAIAFSFGNLIVDTVLRVAFGGRFQFGRGGYNG